MTRAMAEAAYQKSSDSYVQPLTYRTKRTEEDRPQPGQPRTESISIDAVYNAVTGEVEYRGVETASRKQLFREGPFADGTVKITLFLAIVHALKYGQQHGITCPIYCDNYRAIQLVRERKILTYHPRKESNVQLFSLVDRSLAWLRTHQYKNELLLWNTKAWGDNPASFD